MTVCCLPRCLSLQIWKGRWNIRLTQSKICENHLKLVGTVTPKCFSGTAWGNGNGVNYRSSLMKYRGGEGKIVLKTFMCIRLNMKLARKILYVNRIFWEMRSPIDRKLTDGPRNHPHSWEVEPVVSSEKLKRKNNLKNTGVGNLISDFLNDKQV